MRVDTVVKNGKVVSPGGITQAGIAIKNGKIVAIASDEILPEAERTLDAKGNYILPGIIDAHCHVGWPDWPIPESYRKDTEAAAIGGVTTVIDRVTLPPGSLVKQLFGPGKRKDILEENAYVDVALQACLFTSEQIEEVPKLVELGIVGFKFYIPYRGPEVVPPMVGIHDGILYFGFKKIAESGGPAFAQIHSENIEVFFKFKDKFVKEGKEVDWLDTRPNFCEIEPLIRCGYFAKITGCPVYVVHMSVKEGPSMIAKVRADGVNMIAETCPQYLTLTKDNVDRVLGKVNPPLELRKIMKVCGKG